MALVTGYLSGVREGLGEGEALSMLGVEVCLEITLLGGAQEGLTANLALYKRVRDKDN
jgi:hypothetical protein